MNFFAFYIFRIVWLLRQNYFGKKYDFLIVNIETSWRQIIDERIKAKSRHFRSATSESNPVKNRFANLAKVFFYPLTVMEQHREHLDLLVFLQLIFLNFLSKKPTALTVKNVIF